MRPCVLLIFMRRSGPRGIWSTAELSSATSKCRLLLVNRISTVSSWKRCYFQRLLIPHSQPGVPYTASHVYSDISSYEPPPTHLGRYPILDHARVPFLPHFFPPEDGLSPIAHHSVFSSRRSLSICILCCPKSHPS